MKEAPSLQGRFQRAGGGLAQTADRGIAHGLRYLTQHGYFLRCRAQRPGVDQPQQRLLLPHHADAARNALATRFMAEETGNAHENQAQINRVVK